MVTVSSAQLPHPPVPCLQSGLQLVKWLALCPKHSCLKVVLGREALKVHQQTEVLPTAGSWRQAWASLLSSPQWEEDTLQSDQVMQFRLPLLVPLAASELDYHRAILIPSGYRVHYFCHFYACAPCFICCWMLKLCRFLKIWSACPVQTLVLSVSEWAINNNKAMRYIKY